MFNSPAWAQCDNDASHALQDMASWKEPWSKEVPKGFKIDQRRVAFATDMSIGRVPEYSLPSDDPKEGQVLDYIGSFFSAYKGTAACRVQAPDGRWWLAIRNKVDGNLSYALEGMMQAQNRPTHE